MKKITNNIYATIAAISVFLVLVNIVIHFFLPEFAPNQNIVTIILLWILTSIIVLLVSKSTNSTRPTSVTNKFMIGSILKMFVLFIYIVAMMVIKVQNLKILLIYLLIYFALFLILEVFVLVKRIKQ